MPMNILSRALTAAALGLPLAMSLSPAEATTAASVVTTDNGAKKAAKINPEKNKKSCPLQIVSYFDEASLVKIDTVLNRLQQWIGHEIAAHRKSFDAVSSGRAANVHAETADVFGEAMANLENLEYFYTPGTAKGLDHLKKNPVNVLKAGFAYLDFVTLMKAVIPPADWSDLQKRHGGDIRDLEIKMTATEFLIDKQIEGGCDYPKPDSTVSAKQSFVP